MRRVFGTMGTVASLDLPVGPNADAVARVIEDIFSAADNRFSLYLADSELSRIADGRLRMTNASEEIRSAYAAATFWRLLTDGAFSPNRPDGIVDLNGIVKANAIDEAGRALSSFGFADWSLNVGGDMLCSGAQPDGARWTTGIVDPTNHSALACAIELRDDRRAIATSGSAERGDHIWRGATTTVPEFLQVTVVANDIITADVLATAIVAGGTLTLDLATTKWPIDVFAVRTDGRYVATPGVRVALAA